MERRVIIDTNALYILLLGAENEARQIALFLDDSKPAITPTIISKLLHVLTLRYLRKHGLIKGVRDMRKWIATNGYPQDVIVAIEDLLKSLNPDILTERLDDWKELIETAKSLKLMSNDALIAIAAKRHNVDRMITFDSDFKRVPWIDTIP
ncbi:MAG: PIN domain-containing protein [Desulfurococcales archaeon]|nr:PIN domain-containing protein [Desulfurococcales archaeon]